MKTKKMINNAVNTTKKVATKANDFALNTTEGVVTETLDATAQWQKVANKALKGSLSLAATQQDLIFDALDGVKGNLQLSKKRFTKLITS